MSRVKITMAIQIQSSADQFRLNVMRFMRFRDPRYVLIRFGRPA
jgi:hypothetical protein